MSKERSRRKQSQKAQTKARATAARRVQQRSSLTGALQRHPTQNSALADSKQAQILRLLHSSLGTTIDAMAKATGWQRHSVRGFLSGVVRNKLGLNLISEAGEAGRVYRIRDRKASSVLQA